MPDSTPWTGPVLYVPITVEALPMTVNSKNLAWSWAPPDYRELRFFKPADAAPFTRQAPTFPGTKNGKTGIILHWSLPDALTRGSQIGGAMRYPDIPNRWLVVRKYRASETPTTWSYALWIVASDYVNTPEGGSPFIDPAGVPIVLGASWPIAAWPGERAVASHAVRPPLTAVGAGDATWAAYVPNVSTVLAFRDPLEDVALGPVSYSVFGWYAAPAADPMNTTWQTVEEWKQLTRSFNWSVGDDKDLAKAEEAVKSWAAALDITIDPTVPRQVYPSRTLCHGMVFEVSWFGTNGDSVSGVPPSDPSATSYVCPRIAIANSGIDALAALIGDAARAREMSADEVSQLINILEAFQYELLPVLEQPDGQAQLDLAIQEGWFSSSPGGTVWSVVSPRDREHPTGDAAPPPLTPTQAAQLSALNNGQSALDAAARALAGKQGDLFTLWWKGHALDKMLPRPEQTWKTLVDNATSDVKKQTVGDLTTWQALRASRDQALLALSSTLADKCMTLVASAAPPFWQPNDPVLMVTGARRSYEHGEDGRFTADGSLFCRFTGQTISGITVQVGGGSVVVSGAQVGLPSLMLPDLPREVTDLVAEAFFLDLTDAPVIATSATDEDPWSHLEAIRAEQTLIWHADTSAPIAKQTLADGNGLVTMYNLGALPSKIGVQLWAPPWAPLYFDWSVVWTPAEVPARALEPWTFGANPDDPRDDFTYTWSGTVPPPLSGVTISGRTFVTPQATDVLAKRIEDAITHYAAEKGETPDLWALQETLNYVLNADLLSQALSGFNLALLEQSPRLFATPTPSDAIYPLLHPMTAPSFSPAATPLNSDQFNPIRGGHFELSKLWVVDGFGQFFDVLCAMPGHTPPILGTDLVTPGTQMAVELKPRITQSVRLRFLFLDAFHDDAVVGVATTANPICGWMIPNRLDRSLVFYAADGEPLGELLLAQGKALWFPSPADHVPSHGGTSVVDIANPHLAGIVNGVLDMPDSAAALMALLALIDDAAWSLSPRGGWAAQELPALIGTPMVVVRARLSLEVQGDLATSQLYADTGKHVTDDFEAVAFPVQLGSTELLDDGLVGAYVNDDYGSIDSVHCVTDPSGYVSTSKPALTPAGKPVLLTMLMAPLANIHALTGILPAATLSLPGSLTCPALSKMAITFRVGPVIGNASAIAMPIPTLQGGTWEWLQYLDTKQVATPQAVVATDALAHLPNHPPLVREGWLGLVLDGPPTTFRYTVTPTSVTITSDPYLPEAVVVQLTVYNPSSKAVSVGQLAFTFPIGSAATDLTEKPKLFSVSLPKNVAWTTSTDGMGKVLAVPNAPNAGLEPGESLAILVAGVQINGSTGNATIGVAETTDTLRQTTLTMTKVQS